MIARNQPSANVIFHQAALGDFVLTWPLLRALRERTIVVAPWSKARLAADVFAHVEPMDIEMLEFARLHAAGGPTHVSPAVRDLLDAAGRIISFVSTGGDAWAANIRRLAPRASAYFVRPRPPGDWARHVCAWHEAQLERQDWPLHGEPHGRPATRRGPIVVHPGSGGAGKCWPVARFVRLVRELRAAGRDVRVVVGEVECETWSPEPLTALKAERLQTLGELFFVLQAASAFVGNDAGPTHLAAQLGLATVALFGPTPPAVWSPVGPAVTVLAPPTPQGMDWLGVDAVLSAV